MVKEKYAIRDTCVWTIVAPRGSKINITFTEFKISPISLHSYSWIRFHQYDYGNDNKDDNESLNSPFWYIQSQYLQYYLLYTRNLNTIKQQLLLKFKKIISVVQLLLIFSPNT